MHNNECRIESLELRMMMGSMICLTADRRYRMQKENIIKEKTYIFALEIIKLVRKFPNNNEGSIIGKQLLKSATSIGANVEEAVGAFIKNDFIYKMGLALKEARETNYWLRLVRNSHMIDIEIKSYIRSSEELRKILIAIVKKARINNADHSAF